MPQIHRYHLLRLAAALSALVDYAKGKWLDPIPFRQEAEQIWTMLGWSRLSIDDVIRKSIEDETFIDNVIDTILEAGLVTDDGDL